MPPYADLADLPEDQRIDIIGKVASGGARVGFIVEDQAKADRYIEKLQQRFKVSILSRGAGPVPHTIAVTVGPPMVES